MSLCFSLKRELANHYVIEESLQILQENLLRVSFDKRVSSMIGWFEVASIQTYYCILMAHWTEAYSYLFVSLLDYKI